MKLYIVIYHHRHGIDVWPRFENTAPDEEEEIAGLDDFEENEYIEIMGPYSLPVARAAPAKGTASIL